jgi:hypothetical protein
MARLLRVRGDDDAARETLAPVYGSFSEESEMPDIVTARALLDGLGAG